VLAITADPLQFFLQLLDQPRQGVHVGAAEQVIEDSPGRAQADRARLVPEQALQPVRGQAAQGRQLADGALHQVGPRLLHGLAERRLLEPAEDRPLAAPGVRRGRGRAAAGGQGGYQAGLDVLRASFPARCCHLLPRV
jgi:hypothetical protein